MKRNSKEEGEICQHWTFYGKSHVSGSLNSGTIETRQNEARSRLRFSVWLIYSFNRCSSNTDVCHALSGHENSGQSRVMNE